MILIVVFWVSVKHHIYGLIKLRLRKSKRHFQNFPFFFLPFSTSMFNHLLWAALGLLNSQHLNIVSGAEITCLWGKQRTHLGVNSMSRSVVSLLWNMPERLSLSGFSAGWLERAAFTCWITLHILAPAACSLGGVCPFGYGHTCAEKDEIITWVRFMDGQRMTSSDELGPPSGGEKTALSCVLHLALRANHDSNLEILPRFLHNFHSLNVLWKEYFSFFSLFLSL